MPSIFDRVNALGDDQLANQYEILFPTGIPFEGLDPENLSLRIDQAFDLPGQVVGEIDLYYQGSKVVKLNKSEDTDKRVTFTARIDTKWALYDALNRWLKKVYDPVTGVSVPSALIKSTIIIRNLGNFRAGASVAGVSTFVDASIGETAMTSDIVLLGVVIKELQLSTFDPGTTDAKRMTITFVFDEMVNNTNINIVAQDTLNLFTNGIKTFSQAGRVFSGR